MGVVRAMDDNLRDFPGHARTHLGEKTRRGGRERTRAGSSVQVSAPVLALVERYIHQTPLSVHNHINMADKAAVIRIKPHHYIHVLGTALLSVSFVFCPLQARTC